MSFADSYLWVEKFRPQKIEDCVLPAEQKQQMIDFIKSGEIPHMMFVGSAGVGKTTLAKAIANELGADLLYINASNESGIDTVRTKIVQFASTVSFEGNLKIILLDEFDGMSQSSQGALRGISEEFHNSTRFIFTANFGSKIIDAIHSRCAVFDFKITNAEKPVIAAAFFKRIINILDLEKVEYDKAVVAALVQKYFPDFRKTLNELQRYSAGGSIDSGILVDSNTTFDALIKSIQNKKFGEIRAWVARNSDMDPQSLFRYFYDNVTKLVEGQNVPEIILLIAQYQDMSSRVVDQEINNMAFLIEILSSAKWK